MNNFWVTQLKAVLWFQYWLICTSYSKRLRVSKWCILVAHLCPHPLVYRNYYWKIRHLLWSSIKTGLQDLFSKILRWTVKNIISLITNGLTTPVRVVYFFSERNLSRISENYVSSFQSHAITAAAAFIQLTMHVSSYLQKEAHQTNLFYIMIQVTGTHLVSHSMIFMT